jgi:hypothetical protein
VATTGRSRTKPSYMPAASTSPAQDTPPRPGLWPATSVAGPGYTADMTGQGVTAHQSKPPSCSCRADAAPGPADRRSSTSVSRRPRLPGAGTRWDT